MYKRRGGNWTFFRPFFGGKGRWWWLAVSSPFFSFHMETQGIAIVEAARVVPTKVMENWAERGGEGNSQRTKKRVDRDKNSVPIREFLCCIVATVSSPFPAGACTVCTYAVSLLLLCCFVVFPSFCNGDCNQKLPLIHGGGRLEKYASFFVDSCNRRGTVAGSHFAFA